ncbi:DUF2249 domain-containing protein [Streptomyces sp. CdTB01]|uniref:DUF2249 domain-containing protein n=1 Tax=Streptomyces sp. CdTB01 TaxID=1725411 RepID=UPI00073AC9FF|nr:DUF2249 domain-containing protein [Streptomyces sp. CdTB01]ALV32541.1 cation-binding protein [Streptomyces sp. CdTB01]
MSALTVASAPEDALALEAAEAHQARTAGELAGRVALLTTAAGTDPSAAERVRAGLAAFCDREVLPYAAAKEAVLYPAARTMPDARLLIVSLVAEHRCLAALVDALREAEAPADAVADARALQVLFEEHIAKENGLVLPLLAMAPGVSLAALLTRLHDRLPSVETPRQPEPEPETPKKAGGCGCGGARKEAAIPELDVRAVPHPLRHASVLGALDAVPAGGAMVLVAPHDPLPLLAQIEDRHPGVFAVEYLERGPETWRLRLGHR